MKLQSLILNWCSGLNDVQYSGCILDYILNSFKFISSHMYGFSYIFLSIEFTTSVSSYQTRNEFWHIHKPSDLVVQYTLVSKKLCKIRMHFEG